MRARANKRSITGGKITFHMPSSKVPKFQVKSLSLLAPSVRPSFPCIDIRKLGKLSPLMDGLEYGQSKGSMKAVKMNAEQESIIVPKGEESRSPSEAFPLVKDCTECFFHLPPRGE